MTLDTFSHGPAQLNRQRICSSGQSGQDTDFSRDHMEDHTGGYDSLSDKDKLPLILSKLSRNEQRVKYIQYKVDFMVPVKMRVTEIENIVKSHSERLRLLEYKSLEGEARSRRRNLLFKGIPENRYKSCFKEARRCHRYWVQHSSFKNLFILCRREPSVIRP